MTDKQTGRNGNRGKPGPGRPKGSVNKTTALLKDAILKAAEEAGGSQGMVGYLAIQAEKNPGPFMSLLGKVLPMQVNHGDADGKAINMPHLIALVPPNDDSKA